MNGDTKRLFLQKLNSCNKIGSVEEIWNSFKNTLKSAVAECAQKSTQKFEKKWFTEEIKCLSKMKGSLYFQILSLQQKGLPVSNELKKSYITLKSRIKKECNKALNSWWEEKANEAEEKHKLNIKLGRGGSLINSLKLIGRSVHNQHHYILAKEGIGKIKNTENKLNR